MHEITSEVPPPTHEGRDFTDWAEVVRIAKSLPPGEYVKVGPFSPGLPHHIRRGVYKQFYDPDSSVPARVQVKQNWTITARTHEKQPKHTVYVYLRYDGDR